MSQTTLMDMSLTTLMDMHKPTIEATVVVDATKIHVEIRNCRHCCPGEIEMIDGWTVRVFHVEFLYPLVFR
jgi:hypothetical protein